MRLSEVSSGPVELSGSITVLVMSSTGLVTSGQALPFRSSTGGETAALYCNAASVEPDLRKEKCVRSVPRASQRCLSCSVSTFIHPTDFIIWQEDTDGGEQLVSDQNLHQIGHSTV